MMESMLYNTVGYRLPDELEAAIAGLNGMEVADLKTLLVNYDAYMAKFSAP